MYRPKKYQRLEPLARTPRLSDVRRLLEAGTKARSCTVEQPWRSEKMKLPFSLTVRVEVGGSEPIWTLYEGEGSNSRVMWSTAFNDVDLLYDVLTLSLPSDGPNIFDPANRGVVGRETSRESGRATTASSTESGSGTGDMPRPASYFDGGSGFASAEVPPHLAGGDEFFRGDQPSAFEAAKPDFERMSAAELYGQEPKWADDQPAAEVDRQASAAGTASTASSAALNAVGSQSVVNNTGVSTSTVQSVPAVGNDNQSQPVPPPYLQPPAQGPTPSVQGYPSAVPVDYQYPQQYPPNTPYPQPPGYPTNMPGLPAPPGYPPQGNWTYPPNWPYPPNTPYQQPPYQYPNNPYPNNPYPNNPPSQGYPQGYPGYGYPGYPGNAGNEQLASAGTVPLTPGLAPSDNAASHLVPPGGANSDLIKKRPNVMLGTLLVEAALVPKTTIDAALQVQILVSNGSLSAMKAAEAVRRAHQRGGFLDADSTESPIEADQSVVRVRPQLGQVLVMAGIISAAQLKAGLHLQGLMRTGAIALEDAVVELRKELGPQDRATTASGKKHEPEEIRKALELVQQAGLISPTDLEAAAKVRAKHGGELSRILIAAGKLDELTVEAAAVGQRFIEAGQLRIDQGIMTLHYCQRMRVGFEEAMRELNIEIKAP
jgi:hypothetical protein